MSETEPYPIPNPDWTPKQEQNWNEHGSVIYEQLETEVGRTWYRRCWRPKMRGDGMMERDHVTFGTPEDYVIYEVEDAFNPWGSIQGSMMRHMTSYDVDTDMLNEAVSDILQAKLKRLQENNPGKVERLLRESNKVAQLYGGEA